MLSNHRLEGLEDEITSLVREEHSDMQTRRGYIGHEFDHAAVEVLSQVYVLICDEMARGVGRVGLPLRQLKMRRRQPARRVTITVSIVSTGTVTDAAGSQGY